MFIFYIELYSGSALRGTLPSIGKSLLHQRNSIGFSRSTSTSKSLGSVLNKQPAKPPRQSLIFLFGFAIRFLFNRSRSDWNNSEETDQRTESLNEILNSVPVKFIDNSDCSNDDLPGAGDLRKTLNGNRNPFGKMSKF